MAIVAETAADAPAQAGILRGKACMRVSQSVPVPTEGPCTDPQNKGLLSKSWVHGLGLLRGLRRQKRG